MNKLNYSTIDNFNKLIQKDKFKSFLCADSKHTSEMIFKSLKKMEKFF